MSDTSLGKLKHTLKERCEECGKNLQVRWRPIETVMGGETIVIDEEYITCQSQCYELPYTDKKKRDIRYDKTAPIKEVKLGGDSHKIKYRESSRTSASVGNTGISGNKRYNRRSH